METDTPQPDSPRPKGRPILYLDNAATSWPKPEEVYQAMDRFAREVGANPGRSGHGLSVEAARVVHRARKAVARVFGVHDASRVLFTLNCTHALNGVFQSLLRPGDHVMTTSLEHNSVIRPLRHLERSGAIELTVLAASPQGHVNLDELAAALRPSTALVVCTHASNVTGAVLPVADIARVAHSRGAKLLVDAAQTAGALPFDFPGSGVDLLCFSGHKGLFGPQGTGGLCMAEGVELEPWVHGGTGSASEQELQPDFLPDRLEAGTPNTQGLAGLAAGIDYLMQRGVEAVHRHEQDLITMLTEGLIGISGVALVPQVQPERRVGLISANVRGVPSSTVSQGLEERYNIMTRPGLHCAPLAHRTSGTFPDGTVRFSVSALNTAAEIQDTLAAMREIAAHAVRGS